MNAATHLLSSTVSTWRRRKRLKVEFVAARLGVAPATWSHWETGRRFPSGRNLALLASYIGLPICRLFCQHRRTCEACRACHRTGKETPEHRTSNIEH